MLVNNNKCINTKASRASCACHFHSERNFVTMSLPGVFLFSHYVESFWVSFVFFSPTGSIDSVVFTVCFENSLRCVFYDYLKK